MPILWSCCFTATEKEKARDESSKDKPPAPAITSILSELFCSFHLNCLLSPSSLVYIYIHTSTSTLIELSKYELIPCRQHRLSSHDVLRRPSAFCHQAQVQGVLTTYRSTLSLYA
eukprot:scaffold224_cov108-Skeletonema_marinoi.AAC.29